MQRPAPRRAGAGRFIDGQASKFAANRWQPRLTIAACLGIIRCFSLLLIETIALSRTCGKVTGLLRRLLFIFIAPTLTALAGTSMLRMAVASPPDEQRSAVKLFPSDIPARHGAATAAQYSVSESDPPPDLFPNGAPPPPESRCLQPPTSAQPPASLDDYDVQPGVGPEPPTEGESYLSKLKWLGLRNSATDGRNAGMGVPLVGTSWLNRPYYLGIDLGTVWVTNPPQPDITRDSDLYGGVYGGWDWDYYWGTELSIQRATPELINENAPYANRGDRMMVYTASMLYYPWGDSFYRPYWRVGIGETDIDYPMDNGHRRQEGLWTFPIGIGIKYPVRRWLAARAELADSIGVGNEGVATQHDITLTFAPRMAVRRPSPHLLALEPQPAYLVAWDEVRKGEGGVRKGEGN